MIVEKTEVQAVADAFREVESWVQSYISEPFGLTVCAVCDGIVRYMLEVDGREIEAHMFASADAAKVAHVLAGKLSYEVSQLLCTLDAGVLFDGWTSSVPQAGRDYDEWTCEVAEHVLGAVESDVDYCRALLDAVDALKAFGTQADA